MVEAELEKDLLKGSIPSCRTVYGCGEVSGSANKHGLVLGLAMGDHVNSY